MNRLLPTIAATLLLTFASLARAATLEVGPGKPFDSLEKALAAAKPADEILVYPLPNNAAYRKIALLIKTPNLTIRAADKNAFIQIDGTNFDYSGAGRVPRAIFQFDPAANDCTLEGFELTSAHNDSHNGAGVRINAASNVTIRRCIIRGNDMGIMSNGELKNQTAANQLIESCLIEKNGSDKEPGYNHNLYLGGTSVTVRACEIAFSLTGHNLKSRAHQNWIEYNYIHDSANRELDLVNAEGNTDAPNSDSVLLGNIITKSRNMTGNKNVIHFGKDGKANHNGTLFLVHNTITTSYISPILDLNTAGASAQLFNNLLQKKSPGNGQLLSLENDAKDSNVTGQGNTFEGSFNPSPGAGITQGPLADWSKLPLPWPAFNKKSEPLQQYLAPQKLEPRKSFTPGAAGHV